MNLTSYAVAFCHHSFNVPLALWTMYTHVHTGVPSYQATSLIIAVFLGYICADIVVYVIPLKDVTYGLHHLLALVLVGAVASSWPGVLRWVPYFTVCEASSLGLMVSYVLKKLGRHNTLLSSVANAYFISSFVFLRIINLAIVIFAMLTGPALARDRVGLGILGLSTIVAVYLMQIYFLVQIIQALRGGGTRAAKPSRGSGETKSEPASGSMTAGETRTAAKTK